MLRIFRVSVRDHRATLFSDTRGTHKRGGTVVVLLCVRRNGRSPDSSDSIRKRTSQQNRRVPTLSHDERRQKQSADSEARRAASPLYAGCHTRHSCGQYRSRSLTNDVVCDLGNDIDTADGEIDCLRSRTTDTVTHHR